MRRRSSAYPLAAYCSIHGCSSGGTSWLVSCPPSQSLDSVSTTRRPSRTAVSAAATPPSPPPTTRTSVSTRSLLRSGVGDGFAGHQVTGHQLTDGLRVRVLDPRHQGVDRDPADLLARDHQAVPTVAGFVTRALQ